MIWESLTRSLPLQVCHFYSCESCPGEHWLPLALCARKGRWDIDRPLPQRVPHNRRHDNASTLKDIDSLVTSEDDGLSLEKVAENLGVGIGYLRYRFPEQSRKTSACYKKVVLSRSYESFPKKALAISDTIQALHEKGIYPSKSMVFRNAPGVSLSDVRNPKLAEIWRVILIELS